MAFEEKQKIEPTHIEEARKRARWAYIKPFIDEIRATLVQEVDDQA